MYNFAKCALGTQPYFCSVHSLHYIGWFLVGDRLCLLVWYMGDIYSFMHKSTSYQSFCMTDQAAPPQLYFCAQYLAGQYLSQNTLASAMNKLSRSLANITAMVSPLQDALTWESYLSRLCIILWTVFLFLFSTYVEYSKIYCSSYDSFWMLV